MTSSPARPLIAGLVGLATILSIAVVVLGLFFNPFWVDFEQRRADAAAWTGFTPAEVHAVTDSILSDIYFGPPTFDASVNGQPVLDPKEREHMVDVRNVILRFDALGLFAIVVLIAIGLASRGAAWFWRSVSLGAMVLGVAVVVIGIAFALFFDAAFELMHELFFPAGSYTFDPRTERLVQLFPYTFWTETTVLVAVVGVVAAAAVAVVGRRRAGRGRLRLGAPIGVAR